MIPILWVYFVQLGSTSRTALVGYECKLAFENDIKVWSVYHPWNDWSTRTKNSDLFIQLKIQSFWNIHYGSWILFLHRFKNDRKDGKNQLLEWSLKYPLQHDYLPFGSIMTLPRAFFLISKTERIGKTNSSQLFELARCHSFRRGRKLPNWSGMKLDIGSTSSNKKIGKRNFSYPAVEGHTNDAVQRNFL